jgi:hypothetical protein
LVRYVVQGFFATDGSLVLTKNPNKYYPRVEAHVIHKELIHQIYSYLLGLGLHGHKYKCKRVVRDPRWKVIQDQYRFQFNGKKNLILFNDLIGFVNPKQKKKFIDFLEYDNEYVNVMKNVATRRQKELRDSINIKWLHRESNPGPLAYETSTLNH